MTRFPTARSLRAGTAILLTALTVVLGIGVAPAAWAHTDLSSSDPADGSTVEGPPAVLRLVFADPVAAPDPAGPTLTLTVAGADPVDVPATVVDDTVSADLTGVTLPTAATYPAEWEIGYRLVATDGDTFTGDLTFTVAGPADATPPATPQASTPGEPALTSASPTDTPAATASATPASTAPGTTVASTTTESSAAAPGTTAELAPSAATGPGSTAAAVVPESDPGISGWWWFAGIALVVLIAGAGYGYARSRRAQGPTT
ncbi:copper resistance CopC family protein [Nakamurella deserti]|uniref:copper resistance CopC family protein n=1 Tax=Nakamurella deserti TaxID=2164074 RepID=UPI000DBE103D|nr:copper resistance protein CopC [Nakamurella deserti]